MSVPTDLPVEILHAHTTMSMLDGASPVQEYIRYAAANGLKSCSCTDHGWLSAAYDLIQGCRNFSDPKWCAKNKVAVAHILPVPGCEFYLEPTADHQWVSDPHDYFHLTVWAVTMEGYQNLISLSSHSWDPGRPVVRWGKAKPRTSFEDLERYSAGLVVGSGCIEGPIGKCLLRGEIAQAEIYAQRLKGIFGDRLFFEVFPAVVDRDYVRDITIQVEGANGITYSFLPTDVLETSEGLMTAAEALQRRPSEILESSPVRVQDGTFDSEPRRIITPNAGEIDISLSSAPRIIPSA